MNVKVQHIALLKCPGLDSSGTVELPDKATVKILLDALGIRPEHQRAVVPFINDQRAKRTHSLQEGDTVFLSLAVGGG